MKITEILLREGKEYWGWVERGNFGVYIQLREGDAKEILKHGEYDKITVTKKTTIWRLSN